MGSLQESLQDIVVEGVTAFDVPAATYYRYIIELKSSKLSIWLEDRSSKKQWFKDGMDKTEYVSSANAIPDASAADYVKCFQDMLDYKLDNSSDTQRKLSPLKSGAVRLEVGVAIRVFRATCVAKYTFDLDPVSVERIDILESKLRDQQEALEKLRGELNRSEEHSFLKLTATSIRNDGSSIICWNSVKSDEFISTGLDGKIKILRGGLYSIGAVVNTNPGYSLKVVLLKNAIPIQEAYPGYSQDQTSSTTLYTIERLENNDELTTTYPSNLSGGAYLSIVRLGN